MRILLRFLEGVKGFIKPGTEIVLENNNITVLTGLNASGKSIMARTLYSLAIEQSESSDLNRLICSNVSNKNSDKIEVAELIVDDNIVASLQCVARKAEVKPWKGVEGIFIPDV